MPKKSPFSEEQQKRIIFLWGKHENLTIVCHKFAVEFGIERHPRLLPKDVAFKRVIDRFNKTCSTKIKSPPGKEKTVRVQPIQDQVKTLMRNDMTLSIRQIAQELGISKDSVWKIIRKDLNWYPYKPKNVVPLTERHKGLRVEFSKWLRSKPEDFPNSVIFTDEKMFEERCRSNTQNERYWAPCGQDPEIYNESRVVGGPKLMCWAAIVDGKIVTHWFERGENVNNVVYLNMLKEVLWPAVRGIATRRQLWFQQDGARAHTVDKVLDWLREKFGDRIISLNSDVIWPPKSPDMAPNDYYLWSVCLREIARVKPNTINDIKELVTDYLASLDRDEVRRAVLNINKRARACIKVGGGHFEHKLKKLTSEANEE